MIVVPRIRDALFSFIHIRWLSRYTKHLVKRSIIYQRVTRNWINKIIWFFLYFKSCFVVVRLKLGDRIVFVFVACHFWSFKKGAEHTAHLCVVKVDIWKIKFCNLIYLFSHILFASNVLTAILHTYIYIHQNIISSILLDNPHLNWRKERNVASYF